MRTPVRFQSQLLYRRSYKPGPRIYIRPAQRMLIVFRPAHNNLRLKKSSFATK